ncbi:MAG: polysaccharide biosynthesis C-terminal domain-containing protein [Rhodobacteraceae bacterium]|nr:polysaccharide biosynthesis C-terminal domain-containing protein [Paracoccaceae bacterium]
MAGQIGGRFLTGSTMSHVVRMTMTGSLGVTFMFLVDAANLFWVSLLGVERLLAALGFAWTIQFFTVSFGMGMMIAVTATVARLIGRSERIEARRQVTVCAISAFVMQSLVDITILVFRRDLLALAGAEGQTLDEAARYLAISVPSLPFMALGMVGSAVLRAEGDAWRAMNVTVISGVTSMLVDPLLILGLGLGLDGAAMAVVLARLISGALSIWYVLRVHDLVARISLADFRRLFVPFVIVAAPAVLTQLSTPFGNYLMTAVIAGHGDSAVAGWAVISRLTVLAFGGLFALSGAIGGIFGQNYGALRFDRVRRTYRDALIFCVIYTSVAWAVLAMSTGFVIRGFGLGGEGAAAVAAFALIGAGAYTFNGALYVANAAFNSLGRPLWSTAFNWMRDGLFVGPLAATLSASFGAAGAVYGHAAAGVLAGALAVLAGWRFVARLDGQERPSLLRRRS